MTQDDNQDNAGVANKVMFELLKQFKGALEAQGLQLFEHVCTVGRSTVS